jgi:hypothetical protein
VRTELLLLGIVMRKSVVSTKEIRQPRRDRFVSFQLCTAKPPTEFRAQTGYAGEHNGIIDV